MVRKKLNNKLMKGKLKNAGYIVLIQYLRNISIGQGVCPFKSFHRLLMTLTRLAKEFGPHGVSKKEFIVRYRKACLLNGQYCLAQFVTFT